VRLSGRVAGALITHGDPAAVGTTARTAAVSIGMALDFSEAAAAMAQENVNPGWLLYRLFRGSREEAQQTRVMSAIYGWNLCVQRVAIVAVLSDDTVTAVAPRRGEEPLGMLHRLLGRNARETPVGQLDEAQWVLLPAFEPGEAWGRIRDLAEAVRGVFAATGVRADVGIGEPHLPVSPVSALRRSYREAVYAARLGPRLGGKAGVHELRTLGPAAFFAPSSPSRRNLAALVLDPLRSHPAALDTLRAYLALDLSVAETAAQLQVHRHTVRNHLERVFNLTGLDPRSLEGALQLKLALLVAASDPEIVGQ
jgi:sugar diacid utilization regulator